MEHVTHELFARRQHDAFSGALKQVMLKSRNQSRGNYESDEKPDDVAKWVTITDGCDDLRDKQRLSQRCRGPHHTEDDNKHQDATVFENIGK